MLVHFPHCLERFLIVWKVWVLSGKFLYSLKSIVGLESFQIFWQVTKLSGKFPECLESFQVVCNFSILSGKFPDWQETFQIVYKLSMLSGKFFRWPVFVPDCLESFQMVWTVSRLSKLSILPEQFPDCLEILFVMASLRRHGRLIKKNKRLVEEKYSLYFLNMAIYVIFKNKVFFKHFA